MRERGAMGSGWEWVSGERASMRNAGPWEMGIGVGAEVSEQ